MAVLNAAWWAIFMMLGLLVQTWLPGTDVLLIGLIIVLQEGRRVQTFWIFLIVILLQEGTGTLAFGSSILSYTMVVLIFHLGRALLEQENILFVLLVSISAGVGHYVFTQAVGSLQGLTLPHARLMMESLTQMLLLPPLWFFTVALRDKMVPHAQN